MRFGRSSVHVIGKSNNGSQWSTINDRNQQSRSGKCLDVNLISWCRIYSRRREDVTDILYSYMPLDLARSLKGSSEGFRTEKHSLVVFIVVLFFCHDFLGNAPGISCIGPGLNWRRGWWARQSLPVVALRSCRKGVVVELWMTELWSSHIWLTYLARSPEMTELWLPLGLSGSLPANQPVLVTAQPGVGRQSARVVPHWTGLAAIDWCVASLWLSSHYITLNIWQFSYETLVI